jgi:hypothetical protein
VFTSATCPGAPKPEFITNHRNGTSGEMVLDVERWRTKFRAIAKAVEPELIGKHERRLTGMRSMSCPI